MVRDTSGGWFSTPIGVKECSHGWSDVRKTADIAEPVVGKRSRRVPLLCEQWMARIGPSAGNSGDSYDSSAPPGRTDLLLPFPRVPLRCTRGYIPAASARRKNDSPKLSRTRAVMTRYDGRHRLIQKRPALTLVEMLFSILLVGGMLVAALNTTGASKLGQRNLYDRRQGHELAQALMAEILAQPYADESQIENLKSQILLTKALVSQTLGPELLETDGTRSKFDDVDDYNGWTAMPPQAKDGTVMTELSGWRRTAAVGFVKNDDVGNTKTQDEGAKLITVAVLHNDVPVATLVALRTLGPPPTEECCLPDKSNMDMLPAQCTKLAGTSGGPGSNTLNTSCKTPIKPVAHWTFDEGAGIIAADSANDHDAAVVGAAWVPGHYGKALAFTRDLLTVPHNDALSLAKALTISAWIRPSAVAVGFHTFINKGCAPAAVNYFVSIYADEVDFGFYNAGWYDFYTTGVDLKRNIWYHIAVSYDITTGAILIYVDGVQRYSAIAPIAPLTNKRNVDIGNTCLGEDFAGTLDDLQVFDVVLTADQIINVMNGAEP